SGRCADPIGRWLSRHGRALRCGVAGIGQPPLRRKEQQVARVYEHHQGGAEGSSRVQISEVALCFVIREWPPARYRRPPSFRTWLIEPKVPLSRRIRATTAIPSRNASDSEPRGASPDTPSENGRA